MANNSYISESNDYVELFEFIEKYAIYGLLTEQEGDVQSINTALTASQQSRLNRALNWGKEQIYAALQDSYEMGTVTAANAPEMLKSLNARLAQHFLELRRYRNAEKVTEEWISFEQELTRYAKETSIFHLPLARKAGAVSTSRLSLASQFDRANQFDNIIPSEEETATPDGYYE